MSMVRFVTLAVVVVAVAAGLDGGGSTSPAPEGPVVTSTSFSRNSSGEHHYADCETPDGRGFRVEVSAEVKNQLAEGQPCPAGPQELLPPDQYPQLLEELQKRMPYGGGDLDTCGEWQTMDREEARQMAANCPPLRWGDLG